MDAAARIQARIAERAAQAKQSFDPSTATVDEVKSHVDAHPDEAEAVLQAETAGKDRSTLVSWLEERLG